MVFVCLVNRERLSLYYFCLYLLKSYVIINHFDDGLTIQCFIDFHTQWQHRQFYEDQMTTFILCASFRLCNSPLALLWSEKLQRTFLSTAAQRWLTAALLVDRCCQTNAAIRRHSRPNTVVRCRPNTADRCPDAGHHRPDSTAHRPDTSCRQLFSLNIIPAESTHVGMIYSSVLFCVFVWGSNLFNVHVAPIHINNTFIHFKPFINPWTLIAHMQQDFCSCSKLSAKTYHKYLFWDNFLKSCTPQLCCWSWLKTRIQHILAIVCVCVCVCVCVSSASQQTHERWCHFLSCFSLGYIFFFSTGLETESEVPSWEARAVAMALFSTNHHNS